MRNKKFVAVFPDEKDEEELSDKELMIGGMTTRSGKNTGKKNYRKDHFVEYTSTSKDIVHNRLMEWKANSEIFKCCTQPECDPLRQFIFQSSICPQCRIIRTRLKEKIIVLWEAGELIELLYNFMRFHIIKVLHPDKDDLAYAKDGSKYFIAYKQLKQGNKIILANMATAFNFPSNLQLSASRPFISCKKIHSMPKLLQKKLILCCQICQMTNTVLDSYRLIILSGRRYLANFGLLGGNSENEPEPEPDHFLLCKLHATFFIVYYHLTHMNWNVHWNCQLRVSQCLAKMPEPPSSDADAAQIIKAINPEIFSITAKFYFSAYQRLNFLNVSYLIKEFGHPDQSREDLYIWQNARKRLQDKALFERTIRYIEARNRKR